MIQTDLNLWRILFSFSDIFCNLVAHLIYLHQFYSIVSVIWSTDAGPSEVGLNVPAVCVF